MSNRFCPFIFHFTSFQIIISFVSTRSCTILRSARVERSGCPCWAENQLHHPYSSIAQTHRYLVPRRSRDHGRFSSRDVHHQYGDYFRNSILCTIRHRSVHSDPGERAWKVQVIIVRPWSHPMYVQMRQISKMNVPFQCKRQGHSPRQTIATSEASRNQQDHQRRLSLGLGPSVGRRRQPHITLRYRKDGFVTRDLVRCWDEHDT